MGVRKKTIGAVLLLLALAVFFLAAPGQVEIHLPGTMSANADRIDFGSVPVGTTKTATYTFKILETSETPGTVIKIAFPNGR